MRSTHNYYVYLALCKPMVYWLQSNVTLFTFTHSFVHCTYVCLSLLVQGRKKLLYFVYEPTNEQAIKVAPPRRNVIKIHLTKKKKEEEELIFWQLRRSRFLY